jgi:nucleoside-diphosphate-sugar epimerase
MHVLVTGANGFIGRALSRRLCLQARLGGALFTRLTLLDLTLDDLPAAPFVHPVAGDLADATWLRHTLAESPVDLIFHLASIPGGMAEQQYELARRVNVDATLVLLEAGKAQVEAGGRAPVSSSPARSRSSAR